MNAARPLPDDEARRLAALHRYDILDTGPELAFDDIALLAAHICKAPMALVSFVDEHRQWFKSRVGIEPRETPRDTSFCTHTIQQPDELLLVRDAMEDPRFATSPLVTEDPHIRFYAGAALVTPQGQAVGALCVKDVVPRDLDAEQQRALKALGRQVVALLELRRHLEERRLLDERHQLVLDAVPSAVVMIDTDDRVALVNAQATKLFGFGRAELIGLPVDRLVPERLRSQRAASDSALRQGEVVYPASSFALRRDGTEVPVDVGLARLVLDGMVFVLVSLVDVSHRTHIEARLNEVQTLQRVIVHNAGCAILTTASDGLITSFNPAAQRMFGYSAEEVIGLRTPDFIQAAEGGELPEPWPTAERALIADLGLGAEDPRSDRPTEFECTGVCKDGSRLPLLLTVTALRNSAGQRAGFLGLAIDISERKRNENMLRAKNEDLNTFAYTVSHDLKAPLRGISGYAQELERRHRENLSDRALFCISQIVAASRNLDQLIEDLLDYSRCAADKPQYEDVELSDLLHRILRDRSLTLTEQSVDLEVAIPRVRLRTWERGLHQALGNIVDNAIKYSRNAAPPQLRIQAEVRDDVCRIHVKDNGIGFDMKYHDRIFGLFNRLVRANEFEGTGAGLAIVAKLMGKLGGGVSAESEPGQGATFTLEVPHCPVGAQT